MTTSTGLCRSLIGLLLLGAIHGSATAGSGGSAYSLLGIGDIRYAPGARSAGMGYAGIGLAAPQYINSASPATWYNIDRTRLEGAALYEGFNSTDGVSSRYLAQLEFHGALLAIPLSRPDGIVLVTGFVPYSNINYDTYTNGSYSRITAGDTASLGYRLHHIGTGGITRGIVGVSWAPASTFSVGLSFNYLFGTLTSSVEQIAVSPNSSGGTTNTNRSLSGVTVTTGLLFRGFGELTPSLRPLSLGLIVTTRANFHTTNQITEDFLTERDTSSEKFGRIGVPFAFGVGVGYQIGERWALAADYAAQPWSEADFEGSSPASLKDSYRLGLGAERTGAKDPSAAWLDRISYRLGATYNATYYTLNNQPINEWGITAGMAFPLSGESRINVAVEYGSRGTIASNLIKDNIFRMTFSLNISDLWFVRYEEE